MKRLIHVKIILKNHLQQKWVKIRRMYTKVKIVRKSEFVIEHTMEIINSKTKRMKLLTSEHQKSHTNTKISSICKEKFEVKYVNDKKI